MVSTSINYLDVSELCNIDTATHISRSNSRGRLSVQIHQPHETVSSGAFGVQFDLSFFELHDGISSIQRLQNSRWQRQFHLAIHGLIEPPF